MLTNWSCLLIFCKNITSYKVAKKRQLHTVSFFSILFFSAGKVSCVQPVLTSLFVANWLWWCVIDSFSFAHLFTSNSLMKTEFYSFFRLVGADACVSLLLHRRYWKSRLPPLNPTPVLDAHKFTSVFLFHAFHECLGHQLFEFDRTTLANRQRDNSDLFLFTHICSGLLYINKWCQPVPRNSSLTRESSERSY